MGNRTMHTRTNSVDFVRQQTFASTTNCGANVPRRRTKASGGSTAGLPAGISAGFRLRWRRNYSTTLYHCRNGTRVRTAHCRRARVYLRLVRRIQFSLMDSMSPIHLMVDVDNETMFVDTSEGLTLYGFSWVSGMSTRKATQLSPNIIPFCC